MWCAYPLAHCLDDAASWITGIDQRLQWFTALNACDFFARLAYRNRLPVKVVRAIPVDIGSARRLVGSQRLLLTLTQQS